MFVEDLLSGIPYYFDFACTGLLLELVEGKLRAEEFASALGLAGQELVAEAGEIPL